MDHVNKQKTQPLEAIKLPLTQQRLIEASAGTGKTYTISGLYLRLLLGHGITEALTCEQILVVTFTNAATEELRDRIRKRIKSCYYKFLGLDCHDPFINELYQATGEDKRQESLRRLDLALKSLDQAAIFTIHGFCQRILTDMAFESALLFESNFTLDDSELLQQSVRDFWRIHCYSMPTLLAKLLVQSCSNPDDFAWKMKPLLGSSQAIANRRPMTFDLVCQQLVEITEQLRTRWTQLRDETETLLRSLPLNGSTFGKSTDGFPKLSQYLEQMDVWAAYHGDEIPDIKLLSLLALSELKLNKNGIIPSPEQAPLLLLIEQLLYAYKDFLPSFMFLAREKINLSFSQLKAQHNLLSPDDLLLTLADALSQNKTVEKDEPCLSISQQLKDSVVKRFPVALIDEFQDTDPLQYSIFSEIYEQKQNHSNATLLMIGDPKQAIYAFRGADIFTYINAREQTKHRYSLDTNYRSGAGMVSAVNTLFANNSEPFKNDAIEFEKVKSKDDGAKVLIQQNQPQAALQIRLLAEDPQNGLTKGKATNLLAEDAAEQICQLLNDSQQGNCLLADTNQTVKAKDIAVLVRDRYQADAIQKCLTKRNIGAVFLSRESVFNTQEANELTHILQALAEPKNEKAIRAALASRLLGYSAAQIDEFNQSELIKSNLIELFIGLHEFWQKRGIMPTLLMLADKFELLIRLTSEPDSERRLTDFRHLAELLQQKSTEIEGISSLVSWYEQQVSNASGSDEQQLRLASEQNLVQIVTIHKCKGLEYPICFIPFVSLASSAKCPTALLHHNKNNQLTWDLDNTKQAWEQAKDEMLAEDLRLLYVALTRPIYRCYLSIANQSTKTKSGINSKLKETAIGYLCGIDERQFDASKLSKMLNNIIATDSKNIELVSINPLAVHSTLLQNDTQAQVLQALDPLRKNKTPWRIGSYSGLVKHASHEYIKPGVGDEQEEEEITIDEQALLQEEIQPSRFNFDRGANAGSFLHHVLEQIDFTHANDSLSQSLPSALTQFGINPDWTKVLEQWFVDLLLAPIPLNDTENLMLAQLTNQQKLVEMEFYLAIGHQDSKQTAIINANQINQLLNDYGYYGELSFDSFTGMLKGFIDLTFEYQGKYYIADYKSNHLGDDFKHYTRENMQQAINQHRYDLQYIIYSLALHRYLTTRISDYNYQTHFGGCYYLFLRGMSAAKPGCGVFYDKPEESLITALDNLLAGKTINNQTCEHSIGPSNLEHK